MRVFFPFLFFCLPLGGLAAGSKCSCTCVVKEDDGKYAPVSASGKDREAAGEALKKELGKRKCEISPDCQGSGCKLD